ncbi:hypothetical protein BC826DRAFT_1102732 [Russula brevipes]|nr:hypothetical protein BC826DRAFT_1102732 [Russula brevipes]
MRHHKRMSDNLVPFERVLNLPMGWTCANVVQHMYDSGGAAIVHNPTTLPNHPFYAHDLVRVVRCRAACLWRAPRLVPAWGVSMGLYYDRLKFLNAVDPVEIWVRTSMEARTMQVAGAMLAAMDPRSAG